MITHHRPSCAARRRPRLLSGLARIVPLLLAGVAAMALGCNSSGGPEPGTRAGVQKDGQAPTGLVAPAGVQKDGKGGAGLVVGPHVRLVYVLKPDRALDPGDMDEVLDVLRKRVTADRSRSYVRVVVGDRIEILIEGLPDDPAAKAKVALVKRLVQRVGFLELKIIADKIKDRGKADFDRLLADKIAGKPNTNAEFT
jgi:hypothetical protein